MQKKLLNVALASAVSVLLFSGCGKNVFVSHSSDYRQITDLPGVTFDMPNEITSAATAITEINNKDNYDKGTFVYKDGESKYLLFNIDSVVIIASNQTSFDFLDQDVDKSLKRNDLSGVWFSADKDGFKTANGKDDGTEKTMLNVSADVSITPNVYGTFSGVLSSVQTDGYECSIFAGMKANSYDDISSNNRKILEHIVKSLAYDKSTVELASNKAVSGDAIRNEEVYSSQMKKASMKKIVKKAGTGVSEEKIARATMTKKEPAAELNDTENRGEVTVVKESGGAPKKANKEEVRIVEKIKEKKQKEREILENEKKEEKKTDEHKKEIELDKKGTVKKDAADKKKQKVITAETNQKHGKNMTSDIYHMIKSGDISSYTHLDGNGTLQKDQVCLDKVYTGKKATKILENIYGKIVSPAAGTSWHVAKFTVSCDPKEIYTNVCIRGLDGDNLRYQGISYSKQTHDIFSEVKSGGLGACDLYVYYEVPNGCESYMLEFGDRGSNNPRTYGTACYKVNFSLT